MLKLLWCNLYAYLFPFSHFFFLILLLFIFLFYFCQGAFLVPYLLMVILCGIPLFYMEVLLGQFSGTGCTGMFRLVPILKGTGYCMVIVNIYCVCYYSVIISYPIRMMYYCFWKSVPWDGCDHSWNTPNCTSVGDVSASKINLIIK